MGSGVSGLTLSKPLQLDYKPVSRLENMCHGSEAFRNAYYAVASGAYDVVMAIGVEKLKDSGYSGLTGSRPQAMARFVTNHAGDVWLAGPATQPFQTQS